MKGVLAWRTLEEPVPAELSVTVDDRPVALDVLELERRHVALHQHVGERWERAVLELAMELPDDVEARLDGRPIADVASTATVSCRPTQLRTAAAMDPVHADAPFARTGRIELWREDVAGRVDVVADLTIASGRSAHRLLGGSVAWTVAVDEPTSGPGSSKAPFRVEWRSFAEDPLLAPFGAVPSYLDLQGGAEPVLFLNTDVSNLRQLLSWERARTTTRDVRDLVGSAIAADAWQVLAAEAVDQVVELDDGPSLPGITVLDNVLTVLASQLPSVSGVDELLERIVQDRASGAGDRLRSEVAAVVARLCGRGEVVGRAATRVADG